MFMCRLIIHVLAKRPQAGLQCFPSLLSSSCAGVDLLSLDGRLAVRCSNTSLTHTDVKRFLRVARWAYKAHHAGHDERNRWH